jgi:hypothetical protein
MKNQNRVKFDRWFKKYCEEHGIQNQDEDIKELALTAFEKGFKVGIEVALSNQIP